MDNALLVRLYNLSQGCSTCQQANLASSPYSVTVEMTTMAKQLMSLCKFTSVIAMHASRVWLHNSLQRHDQVSLQVATALCNCMSDSSLGR